MRPTVGRIPMTVIAVAITACSAGVPNAGSVVRPGFQVSGCANVNEGNVQWPLKDASGEVLAEGFTQATCGTGCVGDFSFEVDYASLDDAPAPATLELFAVSMRDGSEGHLDAIPLLVE